MMADELGRGTNGLMVSPHNQKSKWIMKVKLFVPILILILKITSQLIRPNQFALAIVAGLTEKQ